MIPLQSQSLPTASCVGGLELDSLARSARCIDSLMKAATVRLLCAQSFSQGRMLILFDGGVEAVERASDAALHCGGKRVVDHFVLQALHARVVAGLAGEMTASFEVDEALLFVETASLCSQIRGLDAAFKAVACGLAGLRLGQGIGGKGIAMLTGAQADLEVAALDFQASAGAGFLESQLIARPDEGPAWEALFAPEKR
ncbi:MAG: hypothetical protein CMH55_02380 [Myxococcales bacterium]|nr:hypothetical protein [Myxococcales bacterium]